VSEIRKFSLVYSVEEDRLAWDLEHMNGVTTRLWLTQRLCRRMIEAILPILQKAVPPSVTADQAPAIQSFEQAAAMADFGKTPGVQPTPETRSGLVSSIDLTPTKINLVLTFHYGADKQAVGIGPAELRQTLTVLYKLTAAAGWALDYWPAWIADPGAGAAMAKSLN
jgi:hypothetical protein